MDEKKEKSLKWGRKYKEVFSKLYLKPPKSKVARYESYEKSWGK